MQTSSTDLPILNCEICLKEIPASELVSGEAQDYLLYFCGLECYAEWQKAAQGQVALAQPDTV